MPKKLKSLVLIVTSQPDPHADEVQKHLEKQGIPFVRINSNEINESCNIRYCIPPHEYFITYKNKEYKLSDFRSIWYRKPTFFWEDHRKLTAKQGLQITYKHSEIIGLINNMMHEAENMGIFIISPLKNIAYGSNKLTQFHFAKELGFTLPDTYIGSSYSEIENFLIKHPRSITKSLSTDTIEYGKFFMSFQTERFTMDYIRKYKTVLDYPIQLQEEIEKKFELRITIVGKKVFTCLIDSQALKKSRVDWRATDPEKLEHTIYNLPISIKKSCLKLCEKLGLNFAAIDMAVTHQNEYVFFEVNPNGQYLWIEERTGMPISQEVANLLVLAN